ncbi:MAG TPA: hypothetical protein VHP33_15525 [Polyangiaceae bacterium]|nr:hypothetical protein [Polyangiaceae bacterium]
MLSRDVYAHAARTAAAHLQLGIERVELPTTALGEAHVHGTVQRVFRGPDDLRGASMSLNVSCVLPGAAPPPGGILWTPSAELRPGRVLEAYVSPVAKGYASASSLSCLLDSATDAPAMTIHEEAVAATEGPRGLSMRGLLLPASILVAITMLLFAFFRACS